MFLARSDWSISSEYPAYSELAWVHTNWQFGTASRFPENFPEAKIAEMNEEATPLNTNKQTKFGYGVFRGEFVFLGSLGLATI